MTAISRCETPGPEPLLLSAIEMADRNVHNEEFAVRDVEQFTRRFITFHWQHGVKRTRGNLLFLQCEQQRHTEQSTIRIAFVAFILVHHCLIVTSDKHQRRRHRVPTESALQWHQLGD